MLVQYLGYFWFLPLQIAINLAVTCTLIRFPELACISLRFRVLRTAMALPSTKLLPLRLVGVDCARRLALGSTTIVLTPGQHAAERTHALPAYPTASHAGADADPRSGWPCRPHPSRDAVAVLLWECVPCIMILFPEPPSLQQD